MSIRTSTTLALTTTAVLIGSVLAATPIAVLHDAAGEAGSNAAGNDSLVGDNSTCGPDAIASYDLGFHIAGIFIVFFFSAVGTFATLSLGSFANKPFIASTLQLFKMFGIGVIAATAWIHLLPDAFSQFGSPCLVGYWTFYGDNYVGLFGLIAAFIVQQIEISAFGYKARRDAKLHTDSDKAGITRDDGESASTVPDGTLTIADAIPAGHSGEHADGHGHGAGFEEGTTDLAIIILELGILFHSVIIGVTLGVTDDSGFTSLLIAVVFHQTFEGMAMGALIAKMKVKSMTKYLFFGLAYPLATPIGIAIGIVTRSSFNGNALTTIVVQGILDSLSAGILFYNTYSELMSIEINHNLSFKRLSGGFKAACFFSMYLGASALAVIGIYA
ncbi:high-affinity Zn(2+) transporter zrt1 [Irineochytrium annulatum]|nr:high-affinity Zn(2+) transporter zrt1 [Irineochytrium annulatum]